MPRKIVQDVGGRRGSPGGAPRCASAASDRHRQLLDAGPVVAADEPRPRAASALQEQALLCLTEAELQHMREIAAL